MSSASNAPINAPAADTLQHQVDELAALADPEHQAAARELASALRDGIAQLAGKAPQTAASPSSASDSAAAVRVDNQARATFCPRCTIRALRPLRTADGHPAGHRCTSCGYESGPDDN
jgi:hypothetical protein